MANINTTHENDVIFNMDSLREFIKLIKKQGAENIDFYAVSELLQPPGENVTTIALTGSRDENLQPWIDLYNNTRRQEMEENLQNNGNGGFVVDSNNHNCTREVMVDVWQYTPAIQQRICTTNANNQVIAVGGWETKEEAKFELVTDRTQIKTSFQARPVDYTLNEETNIYEKSTQAEKNTGYTQADFDTKFNLVLNFEQPQKEKDSVLYSMNYYSNLEDLLSNLNTKSTLDNANDQIPLYLNRPAMPTGNKVQLFFVLNANEKAKLINLLSAYLDYNKQINRLQDEKLVSQYERKRIQNDNNEPWWKFIYVKHNGASVYSIEGQEELEPYREFNLTELQNNPGKIVVVRKIFPWQPVLNGEEETEKWKVNISTGRHLYLQAGSLLEFNPDDFTTEQSLIDDYLAKTTPGTFSVNENNGQKVHVITVRGFDENGDFNNKGFSIKGDPIGYTKEADIPSYSVDKNGKYKIKNNNYNLTDSQKNNLLKPVIDQNGNIIGYIKPENIPSTTNENGNYEIDGKKYNLESNVIIQITTDIVPVYEANNNSITTNIINADEIKLNGSSGTKAQFLRGDNKWVNELEGTFQIAANKSAYLKIGAYGGSYGTSGTADLWYCKDATGTYKANTLYVGSTNNQNISAAKVYNAVFNDYAECRKTIDLEPGRVVIDNDDGSLSCASKRLLPGAQIISDTFGNLMGETDECQTPIAVAGRVLVYTYQPRENYHAGMAVCSAPNGTIDIMTREEIKEYPDCIIGIVSEIPNYEKWGTDQVDVNGRIWIKIK